MQVYIGSGWGFMQELVMVKVNFIYIAQLQQHRCPKCFTTNMYKQGIQHKQGIINYSVKYKETENTYKKRFILKKPLQTGRIV